MATLNDIGVSAAINILSAFGFLIAFALIRIQPINDRVYFTKWYISGQRSSPQVRGRGGVVSKFINLDARKYLTFLNWIPQALGMSEAEIIRHAGLDSAVFLRIHTLGLKIFGPIAIISLLVLIPVNTSGDTSSFLERDLVLSNIDKLSTSNVHAKSSKFFVHIAMQYLFTFWACFMLYKEYGTVASMRLKFLASQGRRPEQFTVLVRNIPRDSQHSVSECVESFFQRNHPDHYLCHQAVYNAKKFTKLVKKRKKLQNWLDYYQLKFERHPNKRPTSKKSFLGLWGERVDLVDFYKKQIEDLDQKIMIERERVLKDAKSMSHVAFVSFKSRWGAAICAQMQQSKYPSLWSTNWAPEPRDVYWKNLAISFVSIRIRKLVIAVTVFFLVFFYMIPIAVVQSLANLERLQEVVPFLRPIIERKFTKSLLQGFLPGLILKIFLLVLPMILMIMSKIEGYVSFSELERETAVKYYYFILVNVFLGSIVAGTAFEQLYAFLHQSATEIPKNIGVSIPSKATFFITYVMVDGWAAMAGEIFQLKRLVIFHLKRVLIVKTQSDLQTAMDPQGIDYPGVLPSLQLYFLVGLVYMAVTPILLPFILVFFAFAFFVYRHQVINVYSQTYESAAAFWPQVHSRIIIGLVLSQLLLMGLLSTQKAPNSTHLLVALPILTVVFHKYCKNRFGPAFRQYPLEEAMNKDTQDHQAAESDTNLKAFLADAYLHPIFHSFKRVDLVGISVDRDQSPVANPAEMELSVLTSPNASRHEQESSHVIQHGEVELHTSLHIAKNLNVSNNHAMIRNNIEL